MARIFAWTLAFSFVALLIEPLAAQSKNPKFAITDPADVDVDYEFQGEYMGRSFANGYRSQSDGLQVIALGDGKFEGVLYTGGLPGAGWNRTSKSKLSGERNGDVVELKGDGQTVFVQREQAALHSATGEILSLMDKIHRVSSTMHARAPANATILFDGSNTDQFEDGAKINDAGLLQAGVTTKMKVGDFRLHLEFRTPYMPYARGQSRGNSGVYIQRRYELQVLDSFGLEGVANECGGLYRQQRADVNMALPPLVWQTYDIYFTAARFDTDGNKTDNARITAFHNGVMIHDDYQIVNKTGAGRKEGPDKMPIHLQHHGDPVVYRNIWIVDLSDNDLVTCCPCDCRRRCR